ncbi:MAG: hypothetical protein WA125_14700 [Desulfosporosinus sp.]
MIDELKTDRRWEYIDFIIIQQLIYSLYFINGSYIDKVLKIPANDILATDNSRDGNMAAIIPAFLA